MVVVSCADCRQLSQVAGSEAFFMMIPPGLK